LGRGRCSVRIEIPQPNSTSRPETHSPLSSVVCPSSYKSHPSHSSHPLSTRRPNHFVTPSPSSKGKIRPYFFTIHFSFFTSSSISSADFPSCCFYEPLKSLLQPIYDPLKTTTPPTRPRCASHRPTKRRKPSTPPFD